MVVGKTFKIGQGTWEPKPHFLRLCRVCKLMRPLICSGTKNWDFSSFSISNVHSWDLKCFISCCVCKLLLRIRAKGRHLNLSFLLSHRFQILSGAHCRWWVQIWRKEHGYFCWWEAKTILFSKFPVLSAPLFIVAELCWVGRDESTIWRRRLNVFRCWAAVLTNKWTVLKEAGGCCLSSGFAVFCFMPLIISLDCNIFVRVVWEEKKKQGKPSLNKAIPLLEIWYIWCSVVFSKPLFVLCTVGLFHILPEHITNTSCKK